jgi:outer membrane lipopolysaccharide assembly protein LptE/RlpB
MKLNSSLLALTLALAVLTASVGCGYGLVGRTSNLPEDVRSIFVETLENKTTRAQVDQILTVAITNEFVTRQRFNVVSDRASADAVLTGTVSNFRVRPVTFTADGRAREYEILITAQMRFTRTDDENAVLWENPAYLFRNSYELELDAVSFVDAEDQALVDVAEKFAETMVIDLLEGF